MSPTIYGLLGKKLGHSFSKEYFTEKFISLGLSGFQYLNFSIENEIEIEKIFDIDFLQGFNITVPYKKAIIPFLDTLSEDAAAVGAVNTVKKMQDGSWKGFNTDVIGFEKSFIPMLPLERTARAVVFGTGGASCAVQYVLGKNNIPFVVVGRKTLPSYKDFTLDVMQQFNVFINATSVGMYPAVTDVLPIPYSGFHAGAFAFDLIYNPPLTTFLREAQQRGAIIKNGLEMLHIQAEESWKIWQI